MKNPKSILKNDYSFFYIVYGSIGICFVFLSIFTNEINILRTPFALTRKSLETYSQHILIIYLTLPFISFHLLHVVHTKQRIDNITFLIIFSIFMLSYGIIESRPDSLYGYFRISRRFIFLFLAGFFYIRYSIRLKYNINLFLIISFLLCSFFLMYFSYFVYTHSLYRLIVLPALSINKPQFVNNLLVSTEFSNILALVAFLGYFLVWQEKRFWLRSLLLIITICLIFGILFMFSLGTIGVFFLFIFLHLLHTKFKKYRYYILIILFIIMVLATGFKGFDNLYYEFQQSINERLSSYSILLSNIIENPFLGYGTYSTFEKYGFYPHHNVLGIWAECGILSAFGYIFLLIFSFFCFVNVIKNFSSNENPYGFKALIQFAAFATLFLHLKGFVHDTWFNYPIFLFTGILAGSRPFFQTQKHGYSHG